MTNFTPEKSKKIALARLDLLNQWKEFRRKSDNKLQADYDFVNLHNTSNSHLFEILGKISRGTLHRWKNILNGTEDYTKLIPQYKYAKVDEYRTCLTDEEIKIFMGLLLHANRLCIGKAIALTKYKLKEQGQSYIPADITFRVYQDNGRAFRAKYFTDDKGFTELGFNGLYSKLGIETVFAKPYNARAKVIERFFKEFQEGFEKLLPSYVGSAIQNKPAYLMRNEKLHKQLHNDFVSTLDETIKMIDM